jgi:LPP20 lipoprotein
MYHRVYASVAVSFFLLMSACATSSHINTRQIPDFYRNPPTAADTIYGVGEAKMSTLSLSRTTALSRARDDVARQIQVSVKNALTDYAQQSGAGTDQQAISFVENVSRQVADVSLSGCRTKKVAVGDDGTVYALVSYPVSALNQTAQTQFSQNEASAFAEFKADEALKQMDQELKSNPPKAGATSGQ